MEALTVSDRLSLAENRLKHANERAVTKTMCGRLKEDNTAASKFAFSNECGGVRTI